MIYEHTYSIKMQIIRMCIIKDQTSLLFVPLQSQLLPLRKHRSYELDSYFSRYLYFTYTPTCKMCIEREREKDNWS